MNAEGSGQTAHDERLRGHDPGLAMAAYGPASAPSGDRSLVPRSLARSRVLGVLQVAGRVPGSPGSSRAPSRKRVHLAAGLNLARGAFSKQLALPRPAARALRPRGHGGGSPTELTAQSLTLRLDPPPEGVVSQSWVNATVGGPPLEQVPALELHRVRSLPLHGPALRGTHTRLTLVRERTAGGESGAEASSVARHAWAEVEVASAPRSVHPASCARGTVVKRLSFRVT